MQNRAVETVLFILTVAVIIVPFSCQNARSAEDANEIAVFNLYFGDLHSHTSYSDGEGLPDEAFETARLAGADFLAITDHAHELNKREWNDILRSADEHTVDGDFVAIAGYEYYLPGINELNIYGIPYRPPDPGETPAASYGGDRMTGDSFFPWVYDWIAEQDGAVGQWNHPLSYGCPVCWDFYQFDFVNDERDAAMGMLECYNSYARESSYIKALDAGWHVMPTATADTHTTDWIQGYEMRTVLLAPSLTNEDLLDAMRAGRGYATLDSNLQISFTLNDAVMGSTLSGGSEFVAKIRIVDPDGVSTDAITFVEIVSDGGMVVADQGGAGSTEFEWEVTLSPDEVSGSYYFLRVYTESGDLDLPGITAWTAPVWTGALLGPEL